MHLTYRAFEVPPSPRIFKIHIVTDLMPTMNIISVIMLCAWPHKISEPQLFLLQKPRLLISVTSIEPAARWLSNPCALQQRAC